MSDNHELKSIERRALKLTVFSGVSKGLFFSMIPVLGIRPDTFERTVLVIVFGMCIAVFIEYFWLYKANMNDHRIMSKKFGEKYKKELNVALSEIGLSRMIQTHWFCKKYKEHYDI